MATTPVTPAPARRGGPCARRPALALLPFRHLQQLQDHAPLVLQEREAGLKRIQRIAGCAGIAPRAFQRGDVGAEACYCYLSVSDVPVCVGKVGPRPLQILPLGHVKPPAVQVRGPIGLRPARRTAIWSSSSTTR